MRKIIYTATFLLAVGAANAQLTIQSGAQLKTTGGVQVVLNNIGIINNSAATDFSNSILVLKGNSNATLSGSGHWHIKQLKLEKAQVPPCWALTSM
jgi:hypothetical protein